MPIDKIGSTEHYAIYQRSIVRPKPQTQPTVQDTISLTKAARQNAEMLRVKDMAMAAPEIRSERISEMRMKLKDPTYPDSLVIVSTVDRLLDHWGL